MEKRPEINFFTPSQQAVRNPVGDERRLAGGYSVAEDLNHPFSLHFDGTTAEVLMHGCLAKPSQQPLLVRAGVFRVAEAFRPDPLNHRKVGSAKNAVLSFHSSPSAAISTAEASFLSE
ncbi:MAG: hypothetical protein HYZ57_03190 [Acidobacteria bacterium]|nr:hypothetical protein [Acidobacteriota bacterium]